MNFLILIENWLFIGMVVGENGCFPAEIYGLRHCNAVIYSIEAIKSIFHSSEMCGKSIVKFYESVEQRTIYALQANGENIITN